MLDEKDERLGENAVVRHRVCSLLGLHEAHHGIHVGNVHQNCDLLRVVRTNERTDVGDPNGPKTSSLEIDALKMPPYAS